MGEEILVRRKFVKFEGRFLVKVDRNTPIDGDDDAISNFSLEGFHGCSFFSDQQQQDSDVNRFADDDDSGTAGDEAAAGKDLTAEERMCYWESQHFLLQEILEQYDSIGPKLRQEMNRQIEIARELGICNCKRQCATCIRRAAVNQLCSNGFNASLCVSHWKTSPYTPAGWHEYIEVRVNSQGKKKKKQILFVVEVGFRDEFIMAKASEDYKSLINQLPQIYIGKWEHMKAIIRLVCEAAKKSAEEQKIHMGSMEKEELHADEMVTFI